MVIYYTHCSGPFFFHVVYLGDHSISIRVELPLFFGRHKACGILVPQPGIERALPDLEAQSLNHWTAREVPVPHVLNG